MEIGGLMAYAFKIFLGNPDIVLTLTVWTILVSLVTTVLKLSDDVEELKEDE